MLWQEEAVVGYVCGKRYSRILLQLISLLAGMNAGLVWPCDVLFSVRRGDSQYRSRYEQRGFVVRQNCFLISYKK